ncbi:MAG: hypothetical protein JST04_15030 [Bdellovibrionales bacterium]|nr:hypothetical protein [Bdellovibrionales bacterium]
MPTDVPLTTDSNSTTVVNQSFGLTSANTVGATKVKLTWNASTDATTVAYNIYDVTLFFSPRLIKTVPAPATFTTLTGLANASYYSFRVRAADSKNKEDTNTNDRGAIPYAGITTATVTSSTSATVDFNDGSNADEIDIYCKTPTDTDYSLYKRVTNVNLTSANLTGLVSGTSYTCRASLLIGTFNDDNTNTVTFIPIGQATQMVFDSQPGSSTAGAPLSTQPVVKILDANNNVVTAGPDATALVTIAVSASSPTIGTVRGTATVAAVKGVATFSGINLQEAGIKILTASKNDTSGQTYGSGVLTVDSNQFTISAGTVSASNSTIVATPAGPLVANGTSSYNVAITLADQYGNPISGVKPQFSSTISADSITQPAVNTNAAGTSSGSLASTVAGTRILAISSPAGLTSVATSVQFVPGPATKLAFVQQPSNAPAGVGSMADFQVAVEDAQGNVVTTGSSSTASVTSSIFVNPGAGTLSGTTTVAAVNGVATFSGLGINKIGTGYKLAANSAPLAVAYSNAFNITAGVPAKIGITGPATVLSGTCSTAITIQLQDMAGNAANATANTTINLSGLGSAQLFTSSACAGAPVAASIIFTTGSNTKTYYIKDNKAESIGFTATDPASIMATGALAVAFSPAQLTMTGPANVVAGQCSTAFAISTAGADGTVGPAPVAIPITITGFSGTSAAFYSDAACTSVVTLAGYSLAAGSSTTNLYLKDNKAESLSISVGDPAGVITTSTAPVQITVDPSNIDFTSSVTSVVAGVCSPAFTVTLKDAAGNSVAATSVLGLKMNGLTGSSGNFYTSPSCGGAPIGSNVTIPQSATSATIYFKDNAAETLHLYVSDPAANLANSQTINLGVSPSALSITAPAAGSAKSSVCAGPFTINTLDGAAAVTAAITPITVDLSGQGAAGYYYSDSGCTSSVSSFVFSAGESAKTFYFVGLSPTNASPLTLRAADHNAVLTAGTASWGITAAPAYIGTAGALSWFQTGKVGISSRIDGPTSVSYLHFDALKQYLYVVDNVNHRIHKYDYVNQTYVGWIGAWYNNGGIGPVGSNVNPTLNAQCVSMSPTKGNYQVPGWCIGGQSTAATGSWSPTNGHLMSPQSIADDGSFIYVVSGNGWSVNKYDATTGAFVGYISRIGSTAANGNAGGSTLASGVGVSNTCSSTVSGNFSPGWCIGGNNYNASNPFGAAPANKGDGGMINPRAIAYSPASENGVANYIYVSSTGMINRYNADTGQFMGWIGVVGTTNPTGAASDVSNTCATTGNGSRTPGWCVGGLSSTLNAGTNPGAVNNPLEVYADGATNTLYVMHSDNNVTITKYNLVSGAYLGYVTNLGWTSPQQMATDGSLFYAADSNRLLKFDSTGTTYGWAGKVNNANSMSGNAGCSTLVPNANTPGWCLGGTAKNGMEERSFNQLAAVAYDGAGNLITGQGTASSSLPVIKKFDSSTGNYLGTLALTGASPTTWSANQSFAAYDGFDDDSMSQPGGSWVDTTNGFLYVTEIGNGRVKKVNLATGATVGWIGGIASSPTGGAAGCAGANAFGFSPGWCLGSLPNPSYLWNTMIPQAVDGLMRNPMGITGDGTYLYVADYGLHRINKFNMSTGASMGWVGYISSAPTGGAVGCNGASGVTPGWCTGGISTANNTVSGGLYNPTYLTFAAGNIFVVNRGNHRIDSFNATTGAYNGWIGAVNTAPSGGCTTATVTAGYQVSTSGWCTGGLSRASIGGTMDKGGGFYFYDGRDGITTDGTYLYVANSGNSRIDKISLAGAYIGSTSTRPDANYSVSWTNNATTLATFYSWVSNAPMGIWTGGTYIYGAAYNPSGTGGAGYIVFKLDKTSGNMIGWQGNVGTQPTGGDTGCSSTAPSTATPGWCQGGAGAAGYTLGKFSNATSVSGDANFIYVNDEGNHRVTRLPK